MGAKHSRSTGESIVSLNPSEKRRLTEFLTSRGSISCLDHGEIQKLWKDRLVPDLLHVYTDFLMKQGTQKKILGVDEFALIYSALVRGNSEDKVSALAEIIGCSENSDGQKVLSYKKLCKYLTDVLESYFLIQRLQNEVNYSSWIHSKHPHRSSMELTIHGICADLPQHNDEVLVSNIEKWLNHTGLISELHCYVLGSLYNLELEVDATIIPLAVLPTTKTVPFLDISQVVYLNSFLPSENKVEWRFLFSATTHGESFSKFANSISNQGPVLLVVADNKNTFGGFITGNLVVSPRWTGSEESFMFTLSPTMQMFPATAYNNHYAYLNINQQSLPNGLGMGGQFGYWGLWIDSQFGNGECSETCSTYKSYKMLASAKKFRIHHLEAWGVGKPPPSAAERGERIVGRIQETGSVLDNSQDTTNLLEMAGRQVHSKGLRESPPK